jgi:hypothetical protein
MLVLENEDKGIVLTIIYLELNIVKLFINGSGCGQLQIKIKYD